MKIFHVTWYSIDKDILRPIDSTDTAYTILRRAAAAWGFYPQVLLLSASIPTFGRLLNTDSNCANACSVLPQQWSTN